MQRSLRKFAEARKATSTLLELQELLSSDYEELHKEYATLRTEVIWMYKKWDAKDRVS